MQERAPWLYEHGPLSRAQVDYALMDLYEFGWCELVHSDDAAQVAATARKRGVAVTRKGCRLELSRREVLGDGR